MKDGRTHMAHKAEHAVDLETGAVLGMTTTRAGPTGTSSAPVHHHRDRSSPEGAAASVAMDGPTTKCPAAGMP